MIILVCCLVAILSVPLSGGDLRRMADLPIRHPWLVWTALIVQTILVSGPWTTPQLFGQIVHIATYGLAAAFAIVNVRLPMVPVIAAGGALNLAAILANEGVMPASPAALRIAGKTVEHGFTNSGAVEGAHLAWLGDVFAIPNGWPLANVFSIGDIVIVVGVGLMAHTWCRSRRPADGNEIGKDVVEGAGATQLGGA